MFFIWKFSTTLVKFWDRTFVKPINKSLDFYYWWWINEWKICKLNFWALNSWDWVVKGMWMKPMVKKVWSSKLSIFVYPNSHFFLPIKTLVSLSIAWRWLRSNSFTWLSPTEFKDLSKPFLLLSLTISKFLTLSKKMNI